MVMFFLYHHTLSKIQKKLPQNLQKLPKSQQKPHVFKGVVYTPGSMNNLFSDFFEKNERLFGGCFRLQSGYRHKDAQIRYKGLKRTRKTDENFRKPKKTKENI